MITWPFAFPPGVISCIRLRHLRRVVLPQPEGPINAVTVFSLTSKLMFFNACLVPNHASRFFTDTLWTFCCSFSFVDCVSLSIVLSTLISFSIDFSLLVNDSSSNPNFVLLCNIRRLFLQVKRGRPYHHFLVIALFMRYCDNNTPLYKRRAMLIL